MHVVKTLQLEEGMITALPVKTQDGQLVADAGIPLTQHLIAQMNSYGIPSVQIQDDEPAEASVTDKGPETDEASHAPKGNAQNPTYSQRIKSSAGFQRFQFEYTKAIDDLAKGLAPVINQSGTFDKDMLCEIAFPLIDGVKSSIEMFDMLHNMRSVDDSIYAHSMNVGLISGIFGKWLKLPREEIQLLVLAGLLHDVGKAKIPLEVLNKPGKYTDEEFALVKSHPKLSYDLLSAYPDDFLDPG
ncbi:MAG: HD domain-containing protein [Lachnospiraceae bacterium]|nr:HD domain-containing protein [Lachnospiraceae bacterium]